MPRGHVGGAGTGEGGELRIDGLERTARGKLRGRRQQRRIRADQRGGIYRTFRTHPRHGHDPQSGDKERGKSSWR